MSHSHPSRGLSRTGLGIFSLGLFATAGLVDAASGETLRLGNEGVYPPFSMVDANGDLTGFEPDLAREMCKRMEVECEFLVMDFKALIPSMLQGKFDILVSQVTPTPERKEKLLFSTRIVANPQIYLIPSDFEGEISEEGLEGKGMVIGLQRGGAHIPFAQKMLGDSVEYVYYDNPDQIHLDMVAGRVNMGFEAKLNAQTDFLSKPDGAGFKMAPGEYWIGETTIPEDERGLSWVVRIGEDDLMARIDETLLAIIADCTFTEIRKKYLEISILPEDEACAAVNTN